MATLRYRTPTGEWSALSGASIIDDLNDVDTVTTPAVDGASLVWSEADSQWVPGSPAATGSFLPLSGGTLSSNAIIEWPDEAAPTTKILMYGTPTSGFGFGIESGSLTVFASSFVRFRLSSMTGTEWLHIAPSGIGPKSTQTVTWANGYTGTVDVRVTPILCTLRMTDVWKNGVDYYYTGAWLKICTFPAGVPAPPANYRQTVMWNYEEVFIEVRADGVWQWLVDDSYISGDARVAVTMTWAR